MGKHYSVSVDPSVKSSDISVDVSTKSSDITIDPSVKSVDITADSAVKSSDISVDVSVASSNVTIDSSIQSSDISVDSAVKSVDISVDSAIKSADISIDYQLSLLPLVLDLNAANYVSGQAWVDDVFGLVFDAYNSPQKTEDGYIRLGLADGFPGAGGAHFRRQVVTVAAGDEGDIEKYTKDAFIPYDSSFTVEFAFKYSAGIDHLVPIGAAANKDNFKFFGYTGYYTEFSGGGFNFGTSAPRIVGSYPDGTSIADKLRIPHGLSFEVYAGSQSGNSFGGSKPPHSNLVAGTFNSGQSDADFDLGIPDSGIQFAYDEIKCQFVMDIENGVSKLFVNGTLESSTSSAKGVGLSGSNQIFKIGQNMQGGWSTPQGIDVRRLRVYSNALSNTQIGENLLSL